MSHNEENQDQKRRWHEESRRRHEEIQSRFEKLTEDMPCSTIAVLSESERSNFNDNDRAKCPCPGCVFRRMVIGTDKRTSEGRRELEVYPSTSEIQDAFSELLAVIERVRKFDAPSDTGLPLLNVGIINRLRELKMHTERIEEIYHSMYNRPPGMHMRGGNTDSTSVLKQVKVGSKVNVRMVGVVESLDDNSMLMRFALPGLPGKA